MNISDFYRVDGCNYASYDNYRKIASVADGLKPSSRKFLYVVLKNNVNSPKKVSILKSDTAAQTQYLHGDQSLEGVLVSMAQNFAGSNNIPLLQRKGTFGNRLKPVAAAGRYIFTCKEDYLDKIFRKEDEALLTEQIFEGDKIEPKFYIPVIPMLVVNGNVGLTTGFTQRILPRNPKDVIKYIEAKLDGKKNLPKVEPWCVGFNGDIVQNKEKGESSWIISGKCRKVSSNEIEITEIPINYDLESYCEVLDALEDAREIKDYKDLSDNGQFKFLVKLYRVEGQGIDIDSPDLLEKFKLVQNYTEFYTSMNEDNKIVEFGSIYEILDYFYDLRLSYYEKRKTWLINDLERRIKENVSRYVFISGVISGDIVVAKKTDEQIAKQLDKVDKIIKLNDSYDYLVNMPIRSMTKEKLDQLKELLKKLKDKLVETKSISAQDFWRSDLEELKKTLS